MLYTDFDETRAGVHLQTTLYVHHYHYYYAYGFFFFPIYFFFNTWPSIAICVAFDKPHTT